MIMVIFITFWRCKDADWNDRFMQNGQQDGAPTDARQLRFGGFLTAHGGKDVKFR